MKSALLGFVACVSGVFGLVAFSGCASSSESAERDQLTAHVGIYPPPPPGLAKPRLGVPNFTIIGEGSTRSLESFAGAQLSTLAYQTRRFTVIERDQLNQLLAEQNLEGIVKTDELAKAGQVRGVDYLMYGKVTNLRVKTESASRGFGLGNIPLLGIGGFDYKKKDTKVVAECGVDLKLVQPSSGEVKASHFGEFKRIDSIGAFGIEILGAGAEADANLEISEDDKGKILRLALDDAVRKMLPDIDSVLEEFTKTAKQSAAPAVTAPAAAAPAAAAPPPEAAAKSFCPNCGAKLEAGVKFCGGCGAKL